jgi:hypothetical protein
MMVADLFPTITRLSWILAGAMGGGGRAMGMADLQVTSSASHHPQAFSECRWQANRF